MGIWDGPIWTVLGQRVVDDSRRGRLSLVEVELPDGVQLELYELRLPGGAIVVVVRGRGGADGVAVLVRDRPVSVGVAGRLCREDAAAAAAREVVEETGWRPGPIEHLVSFQPTVSTIDSENLVFLARGADQIRDCGDGNEATRIGWIPWDEVRGMIIGWLFVGSSSVVALLAARERLGLG